MALPVRLTTSHCAQLASSVRRSLDALEISLPASCDLARWLADCDWADSIGGPLIDPKAGPYTVDVDRTIALLSRMFQLRDLARALERCAKVPGADPKRIRAAVKRQFDRTITVEAQAQDTVFELEMAALFFDHSTNVTFCEPDLRADVPEMGALGVACKRVANAARLRERISEGAKQVSRNGGYGAVVIDAQPALYATGDAKKKTYFDFVDRREDLSNCHRATLRTYLGKANREISAAREYGVVAVVATAMVWGIVNPEEGAPDFEWSFAWLVEVPERPTREEQILSRLLRQRALSW